MGTLIDPAALAALAALQRPGKPDLTARVLGLFRDETPSSLQAVEAGITSGDLEAVRIAAHTLKSSSAYVGARELSETCAQIERAARDGNLPECLVMSDSLDELFTETLDALDALGQKAA